MQSNYEPIGFHWLYCRTETFLLQQTRISSRTAFYQYLEYAEKHLELSNYFWVMLDLSRLCISCFTFYISILLLTFPKKLFLLISYFCIFLMPAFLSLFLPPLPFHFLNVFSFLFASPPIFLIDDCFSLPLTSILHLSLFIWPYFLNLDPCFLVLFLTYSFLHLSCYYFGDLFLCFQMSWLLLTTHLSLNCSRRFICLVS